MNFRTSEIILPEGVGRSRLHQNDHHILFILMTCKNTHFVAVYLKLIHFEIIIFYSFFVFLSVLRGEDNIFGGGHIFDASGKLSMTKKSKILTNRFKKMNRFPLYHMQTQCQTLAAPILYHTSPHLGGNKPLIFLSFCFVLAFVFCVEWELVPNIKK